MHGARRGVTHRLLLIGDEPTSYARALLLALLSPLCQNRRNPVIHACPPDVIFAHARSIFCRLRRAICHELG